MKIENENEILELLSNIENFFKNYEETERNLDRDLKNKELERDDILHEIELSKLNAIEIMSTYKELEKILKERRILKDKISFINTLKPYVKKFVEKGICAETEIVVKNINTLKSNNEAREYTPRILKNLKCAKAKNRR